MISDKERDLAIIFAETFGLRQEAAAFFKESENDSYTEGQQNSLRQSAHNMIAAAIATERDAMGLPHLPGTD